MTETSPVAGPKAALVDGGCRKAAIASHLTGPLRDYFALAEQAPIPPRLSVLEGTEKIVPLESIPSADAYGGLYAFLASSADAGHITGSIFNADSGLSIRGLAKPNGRERDE